MKFSTMIITVALCMIGTGQAFAPSSSVVVGCQPGAATITRTSKSFQASGEGSAQETDRSTKLSTTSDDLATFFDKFVDGAKFRYSLFQKAKEEGCDFKLSAACALAGEYDQIAVREETEDVIQSAPCVMFTWESSPSCKKAIEALDKVGASVKIVRMDDPWEEGNPVRAEIGKMVGKSSVPMIFIGGEYVGGYDAGVSDEAPGILDMAFAGTLRPKLEAAGAMESANVNA